MATDVIIRESHSRLVQSYQGLEAKKKRQAELLVKRKVVSRSNLVHLIYNNLPISQKLPNVQMTETLALCLRPCTKNIYIFLAQDSLFVRLSTSLEGNKNKAAVRQSGMSSLMCGILL